MIISKLKKNLTTLTLAIIISILILNLILTFTNLDTKILQSTLYGQGLHPNSHQISNNPEKLYELKPSTLEHYAEEISQEMIEIEINSLGFRGIEKEKTKPDEIFRIIILGGSNTYGPRVNNGETYPEQLEKILNEKSKKYEVWNAGIVGYVNSQKVAYAKEIIQKYSPDLIIIQTYNQGRRAFLGNSNPEHFFKQNKELYLENIPPLFFKSELQHKLLTKSKVYRILASTIASINSRICPLPTNQYCIRFKKSLEEYGNQINKRELNKFLEENKQTPIIIFDPLNKSTEKYENIFKLNIKNKKEEYSQIHPPAYVYEYYAQELKKMLIDQGYI